MRKRLSCPVACLVFAPLLLGSPPGAWAQNASPTPPKPDKPLKPSKYSAELPRGEFQDNQIETVPDQERRQLRDSRYKNTYPEIKDSAESNLTARGAKETIVVITDYVGPNDPLPVSRSAAVVVGTILSGKAFVSKDRTYVYSDFQVHVDQVLKEDSRTNLVVGGQIVVSRGGGSIHFPSGRLRERLRKPW